MTNISQGHCKQKNEDLAEDPLHLGGSSISNPFDDALLQRSETLVGRPLSTRSRHVDARATITALSFEDLHMPRLQRRSFTDPEEIRRFPNGELRLVTFDDIVFGNFLFQPGWRWSNDVRPIAGTAQCEHRHVGFVVSGQLHVVMNDGATIDFVAGDIYEIPPGHDAWVVGDAPYHGVEFSGARTFARSPFDLGGGVIATLLFTDIVGSTAKLAQLGDVPWRALLVEHNSAMRTELDRHRGRELKTTGDGFVAAFDSALRAVRCAQAMMAVARKLGLEIRVGCHTGEVEFVQGDVHGVAVHAAARVLSLARDGELLASWTTRDLLAGSNIRLESRGHHALKGLDGEREVFRVLD